MKYVMYKWRRQVLMMRRVVLFVFLLFSVLGFSEATTLTYQYDSDGRMLNSVKADDSRSYSPTATHNISYVMSVGDANTNGMPDSLEAWLSGQWSGSGDYNPLTCDSDGDGMCDMMEWMIGTDPFGYDSSFTTGFSSSSAGGTNAPIDITLTWPSLPNKIYSVESISDIMQTNWTVVATNIAATPPENSWTIEGITNMGYFYRSVVEVSTNGAGGGE